MSKKHADKYRTGNANQLTKAIVQWLNWNGFVAWRNNTMGVFDGKATAKRIIDFIKACIQTKRIPGIAEVMRLFVYRKSHEKKGASDVIGYEKRTGRFLAVEVKYGKDTLKPEQVYFLDDIRKNNGIAIVARDMETFLERIGQVIEDLKEE